MAPVSVSELSFAILTTKTPSSLLRNSRMQVFLSTSTHSVAILPRALVWLAAARSSGACVPAQAVERNRAPFYILQYPEQVKSWAERHE
jgi:hypothetical protein